MGVRSLVHAECFIYFLITCSVKYLMLVSYLVKSQESQWVQSSEGNEKN